MLHFFGERLNLRLFAIKLRFKDRIIRGHLTNNDSVYICNSIIINDRKYSHAKNISLVLKSIHRKSYGQEFKKEPIEGESKFIWTPKGENETIASFTRRRRFDFGYLLENDNIFTPELDIYYKNVNYFTRSNEIVRYEIEIIGDNYYGNTTIIYEVYWNGKYEKDETKMKKNLIISDITFKDYKSHKLGNKSRYRTKNVEPKKYQYSINNNEYEPNTNSGVITTTANYSTSSAHPDYSYYASTYDTITKINIPNEDKKNNEKTSNDGAITPLDND